MPNQAMPVIPQPPIHGIMPQPPSHTVNHGMRKSIEVMARMPIKTPAAVMNIQIDTATTKSGLFIAHRLLQRLFFDFRVRDIDMSKGAYHGYIRFWLFTIGSTFRLVLKT